MSTFEGEASMPVIGENPPSAAASFARTALWGLGHDNTPSKQLEMHSHTPSGDDDGTAAGSSSGAEAEVSAEAERARARAMEIIRKFQGTSSSELPSGSRRPRLQHQHSGTGDGSSTFNDAHPQEEVVPSLKLPDPAECSRRRREYLDRLEERKRLALLKNLEYVARLEDERLRYQLDQIEQARAYQDDLDERYRKRNMQSDNNRSSRLLAVGQAGIGTQQRRQLEGKAMKSEETRLGGDGRTSSSSYSSSSSLAIYVSNLPVDGSADERTMTALFGSYGTVRKIHFYVDKGTGRLKGDALVIYNLHPGQDRTSLTQEVCSQVRCFENIIIMFGSMMRDVRCPA
jgi:hypothetical protein